MFGYESYPILFITIDNYYFNNIVMFTQIHKYSS